MFTSRGVPKALMPLIFERAELFAEPNVPGFARTSIAFFPDVGRENVKFRLRWTRDDGGAVREDRAANYAAAMRGGLGYDALDLARALRAQDPARARPLLSPHPGCGCESTSLALAVLTSLKMIEKVRLPDTSKPAFKWHGVTKHTEMVFDKDVASARDVKQCAARPFRRADPPHPSDAFARALRPL